MLWQVSKWFPCLSSYWKIQEIFPLLYCYRVIELPEVRLKNWVILPDSSPAVLKSQSCPDSRNHSQLSLSTPPAAFLVSAALLRWHLWSGKLQYVPFCMSCFMVAMFSSLKYICVSIYIYVLYILLALSPLSSISFFFCLRLLFTLIATFQKCRKLFLTVGLWF